MDGGQEEASLAIRIDANQGEIVAKVDAWVEEKESTPVEMTNIAAHPEVPNEEAEVETVGALEDGYGRPA
jgi:hypothetical protein